MIMSIKEIIEDIFNFPKTFCAWIVYYMASWLDMRVVPNDDGDDVFDKIFEDLEDLTKEEADEEDI